MAYPYDGYRQRPGIGNVGSYLISGRPYLTGSSLTGSNSNFGEVRVRFPSVTKSFTVINRTTSSLFVHFDSRANTDVVKYHHYLTLPNNDDSFGFDVKTTDIYISMATAATNGSFEVHAELTGILKEDLTYTLSGSGINSVGLPDPQ